MAFTRKGWLARALLSGGMLATAAAVAAPADTDILVNQDGLYGGQDASAGPAGGTFTYVAKVRHNNIGPDAAGVTLTEVLPVGAVFQGYAGSAAGITCTAPAPGTVLTAANNTLTCNIGSLSPADGFKSVAFEVILPAVGTNWRAVASARMASPDYDNDQNNTGLDRNFTTTEAADLAIALSAPSSAVNGGAFQYTVNVQNKGPSEVPAGGRTVVRFPVPNGAVITGAPSGSGWSCTPASGYPLISGELSCTRGGPVAPGAVLPPITVPAIANMSGTIAGAASVKGYKDAGTEMPDGQSGNNTASASVVSSGSEFVDVSLGKQVAPTVLDAQRATEVTYTLQPRREGGSLVPRDLTVTDTLPAGVSFVGFEGSQAPWTCGHSNGTITCTHAGEYPVAGYANMQAIRFKASVAAGGTPGAQLVNQGVIGVAPELNEPNTTNNTASAAVDFSNDARLRLAKAGPSRPVLAGQEFSYTITVTNTGPMPVLPGQQITVADNPVDGRMAIVGMSGTGTGAAEWTCSTQSCTSTAGLAVGASRQLTVRARVTLASGHLNFTNNASAGVVGRDNASATTSATVTVSADKVDVGIVKTVVSPVPPAAIKSGEEVTYQLVVKNHSASTAVTNVRVADRLQSLARQSDGVRLLNGNPVDEAGHPVPYPYPGGGFVSSRIVSGANASCAAPTGGVNSETRDLNCTITSMDPGAEVVIEVRIRPKRATEGSYANTASAQSLDIHDADPGNDSSTASITVQAIADLYGHGAQLRPLVGRQCHAQGHAAGGCHLHRLAHGHRRRHLHACGHGRPQGRHAGMRLVQSVASRLAIHRRVQNALAWRPGGRYGDLQHGGSGHHHRGTDQGQQPGRGQGQAQACRAGCEHQHAPHGGRPGAGGGHRVHHHRDQLRPLLRHPGGRDRQVPHGRLFGHLQLPERADAGRHSRRLALLVRRAAGVRCDQRAAGVHHPCAGTGPEPDHPVQDARPVPARQGIGRHHLPRGLGQALRDGMAGQWR
jgi:uncharacterized repeat protein (TIGR01451 family)